MRHPPAQNAEQSDTPGADLASYGAPEVRLLDGERVESALPLDDGGEAPAPALLLTDKRVIYVSGEGKRRRAMFASIQDVQAVEIGFHARSSAAYVWAALALVAAFFLFFVIENPLGRVIGPVAVACLGAYLVVDNLMSPNRQFRHLPRGGQPADSRPGPRRRERIRVRPS